MNPSCNKYYCILKNAWLVLPILVLTHFIVFENSFVSGITVPDNVVVVITGNTSNNVNTNISDSMAYLFTQAKAFLAKRATSVMDKTQLPSSGDRHDFLSLAPFCWPDPKSPNGLPYICQDKRGVNPEFYAVPDYANLLDMITRVKTLALAYHFSHNETYASKAANLLRVWFLDGHTKMNPNMQFSEVVPGKNNGTSHGIIGAKDFPEIIDSLGMIENSSSWTSQDQQRMKGWFTHYLEWLVHSQS